MSLFDPNISARVSHSGTFNANPVNMRAGLSALKNLPPEEIDRINSLTESLVNQAEEVLHENGISAQLNMRGSMFNIYFSEHPVTDYRSKAAASSIKKQRLFHLMLNEGIRLAPGLLGAVSTPMTDTEVDQFVDALRNAVQRL